jgi:hypothetical protein
VLESNHANEKAERTDMAAALLYFLSKSNFHKMGKLLERPKKRQLQVCVTESPDTLLCAGYIEDQKLPFISFSLALSEFSYLKIINKSLTRILLF